MSNDLLLDCIRSVQQEYLDLLKGYKNIDDESADFIRNEIQEFWFINKQKAGFILKNYPNNFDTCAFTGGAYLDVQENKHYPFLTFGEKHIMDDPVVKFSNSHNEQKEYKALFSKFLKKSIKDNIDILENYGEFIVILPLSYLFVDWDVCREGAKNTFLHLFTDEKMSLEKYKSDFLSLDAIINALNESANFLFIGDELGESPLKERYTNYLKRMEIPKQQGHSEVCQFFEVCFRMFFQIFCIIDVCVHFSLFPFIRENNIFNNFCIMTYQMKDEETIKVMILKAKILHLFYNVFDFSRNDLLPISEFINKIQRNNFETSIMATIEAEQISLQQPGAVMKIQQIICNEMKKDDIPLFEN